jgi:hypothetical protein
MIKARTKSVLILAVTLLIGIAIGFEISEIMIRKKFDEMHAFRKQHGFIELFEGIIKPDAKQKPVVDSILMKYHRRMESIEQKGMKEVGSKIDSMQTELQRVLNGEQNTRLNAEMQRMKTHRPPEGGKEGAVPPPPPQGPPMHEGNGLVPPPHGEGPAGNHDHRP